MVKEHKGFEALSDEEICKKSFEYAPVGMALMTLDGKWIKINQSFCNILGYTKEQLINIPFTEIIKTQKLSINLKKVLQELEHKSGIYDMEKRFLHNDGQQIWLQMNLTLVRDTDNHPLFLVIQLRDNTFRKLLEKELLEERNFVSAVLDTIGSLVLVLDRQGRVVRFNRACEETTGYTFAEVKGKYYYDFLIPQEQLAGVKQVFENLRAGMFPNQHENYWLTKDGRRRLIYWSNSALIDENGEVKYVIPTGIDITDRRQAEEELIAKTQDLERSNAELEQFAYVASHDLQEPLRMVASYVQLLERRYKNKLDAEADEFISYAVDGAMRMQKLINDLLTFSKVGTKSLNFFPVDCNIVLAEVLSNLQQAISVSGTEVTYDTLPTIMGDQSQLVQLLQNLIGNAIKFRGEEPQKVHIKAEIKGSNWLFSVRDNGIGIDPKYHERIFVIFQRLHNNTKYPGTGIGLAMCKKIVERHGGQIWLESEVGQGATFFFTIPMEGGR